ncbi:hypothetical protein C8R44DRAFT_858980 [Mycena epipterygia]|nr:hypothetical protein C8R44DRAFT_858980 [Mycena epipterygia]
MSFFRPLSNTERQQRADEPLPDVDSLPDLARKTITLGAEEGHQRVLRHWERYVAKIATSGTTSTEPLPSTVLNVNTQPPSRRYLAKNVKGVLAPWPSKKTIEGYLHSFYSAWKHATGRQIPKEDRSQTTTWLSDPDFTKAHPLTTLMRKKPVSSHADVEILLDQVWHDHDLLRLPHERAQIAYGVQLMAASSSRPGEIVVSSKHKHEGHCLQWKHHRYIMLPSDDPFHPDIYQHVSIVWLKHMRNDESKHRDLVFKCDPLHLANCPVFSSLLCAIKDGVFLDYKSFKDIFEPKHAVLEMREMLFDPSIAELGVLRKLVFRDGHQVMSESPMDYFRFAYVVKVASLRKGFRHHVPLYAPRRNVAGIADSQASPAIRKLIMGHSQNSEIYCSPFSYQEASYQSKMVPVDTQHMVSGEGEADLRGIVATQSMSAGRDEAAPKTITAAIIAQLAALPIIVEAARVLQEATAACDDMELLDERQSVLLIDKVALLRKDYIRIYKNETYWLIKAEREAFFVQKARRAAVGEDMLNLRCPAPTWHPGRDDKENRAPGLDPDLTPTMDDPDLLLRIEEEFDQADGEDDEVLAAPLTTEQLYEKAVADQNPYVGPSPHQLPAVNPTRQFTNYLFSTGIPVKEQRIKASELFAAVALRCPMTEALLLPLDQNKMAVHMYIYGLL